MKRFWLFFLIFLGSVNTLAAVLYAGVEPLDDGSGFLSLSPLIDCILWGTVIALSGIAAVLCWRRFRPTFPILPGVLGYPAAYLATLAFLSFLVLVMRMLHLLDKYSPFVHLPFWGYVLFLVIAYPVSGYLSGKACKGRWADLLWGVLFSVLLCLIGTALLRQVNAQDAPWQAQITAGSYLPGYTERLMGKPLGGVLGRINLPACVLMGTYEYAHFNAVHSLSRDGMTYLVCLCPPALFSLGWAASILFKKHK